jgi:hypothetical protein
MVRNSNPGRSIADGTPLGYIQQVIFEEQQQRKMNGGGYATGDDDYGAYDHIEDRQDRQDQQRHYEPIPPPRPPTPPQPRPIVETNIVDPIPAAVPALVTPTIPMNQMNFSSVNESTTRVGTTYVLYALIFSFVVFLVLYSLPYVQKEQPKRTTLQNLYMSLGIGIIVSIIIYFTQNKIITS